MDYYTELRQDNITLKKQIGGWQRMSAALITVILLLVVIIVKTPKDSPQESSETTTSVPVTVEVDQPEITDDLDDLHWSYLGDFTITYYCACERCCGKSDGITATGTHATQGRTIAVDPDVIPYDTHVIIDGHEYIAEDCGGAIKDNRIDIYMESHEEALEHGIHTAMVYKIDKEEF